MLGLFETTARRQRDMMALKSMYMRYGEEFIDILEQRANDESLDSRSHKHWQRLYGKARKNMEAIIRR